MKRPLLLISLFLAVALSLSAQQIPINKGTLDYIGQFDTELRQLIGGPLPQITQMGRSILDDSLVILLVLGSIQYALISSFNIGAFLWNLLLKYAFLSLMLTCYDAPLPWFGGVSFHSLIPQFAANIAGLIDLSSANLLIAQLDQIRAGLAANPANPLNIVNGLMSLGISFDAGVLYLLSFGTSLAGWAVIGVLTLLGPIAIGLALLPPLEWIFSGWLRSMFTYAFYRTANAAVVFLGTRMLLWFFTRSVHGDYSLAHWIVLLPFVIALSLLFVILSIFAFMLARDVFHGSSSIGNPLSSVARFAAFAAG